MRKIRLILVTYINWLKGMPEQLNPYYYAMLLPIEAITYKPPWKLGYGRVTAPLTYILPLNLWHIWVITHHPFIWYTCLFANRCEND